MFRAHGVLGPPEHKNCPPLVGETGAASPARATVHASAAARVSMPMPGRAVPCLLTLRGRVGRVARVARAGWLPR